MSWIDSGQFRIANRNGRHYVFRRNNAGNTEINLPKNITKHWQAKQWLKANPNKVRNPTSYKPKKKKSPNRKLPARPFLLGNFSPLPNGIPFNCNTNFFKKVRNSNGATGFKATKLANHNKLYTIPNGKMTVSKGMAQLGKGTQGIVFLAYTGPRASNPVTIKVIPQYPSNKRQVAENEFQLQRKLYALNPGNIVPKPYRMIKCPNFIPVSSWSNANKKNGYDYSKQTVIFSEYINGGSLSDWLKKMSGRLHEKDIRNLIRRVIEKLFLISKRMPAFRHNDLHLDNILVKESSTSSPRYYINDFGWAYYGKGTNPMVESHEYEAKFGIGPATSSRYDLHLFLNELHKWMIEHGGKTKYPKAMRFIEKYLPVKYLGTESEFIRESRLRYNMEHKKLPQLSNIVKDDYIRLATSSASPAYNANYTYNAKSKSLSPFTPWRDPRSPFSARKRTSSRKKKTPARSNSKPTPRKLFKSASAKNKKSVNKNKMKLSPRSFLKLSPKSRAAYMTKPRGNTTRVVVNRHVPPGGGEERVTSRRVAVPQAYLKITKKNNGKKNITARKRTEVVPKKMSPARVRARALVAKYIAGLQRKPKTPPNAPVLPPPPPIRMALPEITYREHTQLARALGAARRAAGRGRPSQMIVPQMTIPPAAPRAQSQRASSGNMSNARALVILNNFANKMANQRTLTRRMLKNKLTGLGYSTNNANKHARAWEAKWIASRQSINNALRNLRAGKSVTRRGYSNSVAAVARRRHAEHLHKSPTKGRVRAGKVLLESKKKPELVAMAQRHGITNANKLSKQEIINALYG